MTHDFKSDIILTNPKTQVQTKIPLSFESTTKSPSPKPRRDASVVAPRSDVDSRSASPSTKPYPKDTKGGPSPIVQYLLIAVFTFVVVCFLVVNFFNAEPLVSE